MSELLDDYCRDAIEHGRCTRTGDYVAGNKAHDRLHEVMLELASSGQARALFSLFNHPDICVQLWAATHALRLQLDEPRCLGKLEEIERAGIPLKSMSAHYVVAEWRNGSLRPILAPPPTNPPVA
jgi:hypothetical protein